MSSDSEDDDDGAAVGGGGVKVGCDRLCRPLLLRCVINWDTKGSYLQCLNHSHQCAFLRYLNEKWFSLLSRYFDDRSKDCKG
jgi:hypothetical protein